MRLFISIDLPKDVKTILYNIQKSIGGNLAKIHWVAPKNLHLTMKFIGEVEDSKVNEIKDRLNNIEYKKFNLSLDTMGFFPNNNIIKIIWVGVTPEKNVIELQKKIDSSLLDLFSKDQRFDVHLTIGRVKNIKNKIVFLEKINKINVKKIDFEVDEFKLMRSTLTKDGPVYEEINSFKL